VHDGRVTRAEDPFLVTTADQSPRDEQRDRTRRYLVTMGVRVACFVLAIVLVQLHLRWAAAVAVAGSLVLPWVAVVAANAGPTRRKVEQPALYRETAPKELP
jgi:Flp pilus assembly protein TadB